MNNISDIMNNINTNELDNFFANTSSKFLAESEIKETMIDYSWLNVLEDTVPSIDKIVRNPRRFIVQEEDVVIVEKIKRITKDTIKHLAEHSENIQDLDKNGDVIPQKLLNVHKEDTMDLYENRFIYTLVKRLENFIDRQLENIDIVSRKEINKKVNYRAETILQNKKVNIELKMEENSDYIIDLDAEEIKDRILACNEIIKSFRSTELIKTMVGCTLVTGPIRKTNLILKEPNFQKAFILWEYLDNFEFKDPKIVNLDKKRDSSKETKDEFTLSYFINCNAIDEQKENLMQYKDIEAKLNKLINEYIYENDQNIDVFTEKTKKIYNNALENKEKRINEITSIYNKFIEKHNNILNNIKEY